MSVRLTLKVTGVLVYDKPICLCGNRYEQRFGNIDNVIEHIYNKAYEYKDIELENYNILDADWNKVDSVLGFIVKYDSRYVSKHGSAGAGYEKRWKQTFARYLRFTKGYDLYS